MNWKATLQVRDLEPDRKVELLCRSCGFMRYVTGKHFIRSREDMNLWVDEAEVREQCLRCKGPVRLIQYHQHKVSGWVGGMP